MRYALALPALAALVLAAPRPAPQDIDLDLVLAAGTPEVVTPAVNTTSVVVDAQSSADVAATGAEAVTSSTVSSRDLDALREKRGSCAAQPAGTYTGTLPADDPASFVAYAPFSAAATGAATPYGYDNAFMNLTGSSQTSSYAGYTTLSSYNPALCASFCDGISGCVAFNIYFERDPSLDPGTSCPNPSSVTNVKCTAWRVQVNAQTATNTGQWRNNFEVVIAGSNGYNKWPAPPAQSGFNGPVELGGALNAPLDPVTKQDTFMGSKFFQFSTNPGAGQIQAYDPSACTAACTSQTAYNSAHPPSSGNPQVCNQVVAYVLSDNGLPLGMYCAMYTEVWSSHYATNVGQYRGNDYYSVSDAYYYTPSTSGYPDGHLYTDSPICNGGGCAGGSYNGGNCGGWGAGTC